MWQTKCKQVIGAICEQSYREANYVGGRKRTRHVPYSVPECAKQLIDCLNRDDEAGAKSLMAHDYDIQTVRNVARV